MRGPRRLIPLTLCIYWSVLMNLMFGPYAVGAATIQLLSPDCTTISECRLCTDSDKKSLEACSETGKVTTLSCAVLDQEHEETGETATVYSSCQRTRADDEFLLVRFQVLCILFGSWACLSSRKQKSASASLFDQRKIAKGSENKRRRSELPSDIEMQEMPDREELVALTENDGLEVV